MPSAKGRSEAKIKRNLEKRSLQSAQSGAELEDINHKKLSLAP